MLECCLWRNDITGVFCVIDKLPMASWPPTPASWPEGLGRFQLPSTTQLYTEVWKNRVFQRKHLLVASLSPSSQLAENQITGCILLPLPRFQKKPAPVLPEQVSDSSRYTCQPPWETDKWGCAPESWTYNLPHAICVASCLAGALLSGMPKIYLQIDHVMSKMKWKLIVIVDCIIRKQESECFTNGNTWNTCTKSKVVLESREAYIQLFLPL